MTVMDFLEEYLTLVVEDNRFPLSVILNKYCHDKLVREIGTEEEFSFTFKSVEESDPYNVSSESIRAGALDIYLDENQVEPVKLGDVR